MSEPGGRRERNRIRTRQALADAALELFLDRGYDQVGVREVADAADVSVSTLFAHFPSKESLVFDLDEVVEDAIVAVVRERPSGRSVLEALRAYVHQRVGALTGSSQTEAFTRMVDATPALSDYAERMWSRHRAALARAIAAEVGAPDGDAPSAALARFALDTIGLAWRQRDASRAVDEVFDLLDRGWSGLYPAG